jgi:hypothetical protein
MTDILVPPYYEDKNKYGMVWGEIFIPNDTRIPSCSPKLGNVRCTLVDKLPHFKRHNMANVAGENLSTVCVGFLPEDDMDLCYKTIKGTNPILIPITKYCMEEYNSRSYANLIMSAEDSSYSWHGTFAVCCNNTRISELQKISDILKESDKDGIPLFILDENSKEKIRLRGNLHSIQYNINIKHDLLEEWQIKFFLRET